MLIDNFNRFLYGREKGKGEGSRGEGEGKDLSKDLAFIS